MEIKFTREEEEAIVEKLKTTWTAFGGLSKEEQDFLNDNKNNTVHIDGSGVWITGFPPQRIFTKLDGWLIRLCPDFKLTEPERWWYNNELRKLHENSIQVFKGDIEVPASDLEYVRDAINLHTSGIVNLDEFELRLTKEGELVDWLAFGDVSNREVLRCIYTKLRFVRKAKPEAVAVQKEFGVYQGGWKSLLRVSGFTNGENCDDLSLSEAWHYAIDRGMGMEFLFEEYKDNWMRFPDIFTEHETPAKCIKVRCWVKEDGK